MRYFFTLVSLTPVLFLACSSSNIVLAGKEFHSFEQIDFESVRFRRPEGALFDPEEKKPLRPEVFGGYDCEKSETFFGRLDLAKIGVCLRTLGKEKSKGESLEIDWKLNKESQPSLKLRDPEDAPACLRELLLEIPFPRELIFIAQGEGEGEESACFSSRLALESGEWLGWELPRARVRLRVVFPLVKVPVTDSEVERLLRTWILSIFRGASAEDQQFHGRFLPTRYCLKCLGLPDSTEHGPGRIPAPIRLWPALPPALDDSGKPSLR